MSPVFLTAIINDVCFGKRDFAKGCDAVITLNPVNRDMLEPHFIDGLGWEAVIRAFRFL